jgi:hypothetical protein
MMPVSDCKTVSRILLFGLLPAFNAQAEDARSVEQPSMDFLEYLGGIENEIDGELSSPVDLDLEALVANNSGNEQIDDVKAENEVGNEAGSGADSEESINE